MSKWIRTVLILLGVGGAVSVAMAIKNYGNSDGTTKQKILVEVWSDVVCPYCFLGKIKLEKAISSLEGEAEVQVVWKAYQLSPAFPLDSSMSTFKYLSEHRGYPEQKLTRATKALAEVGEKYGVDFHFEKAISYNTLKAHRLIQWSAKSHKSSALKDALMEAHFCLGIDLSSEVALLQIVEKVGLSKTEAQQILGSNQFVAEVKDDMRRAEQLGITGVPFFLINGKQQISGAQDDRVFERALQKALEE